MSYTSKHDPAYPVQDSKFDTAYGLTKREYFAALAMQGILARTGNGSTSTAESAVKHADALIEQLNKTT